MKNYKVNPAVRNFDVRIDNIGMQHLEGKGWDFDREYANCKGARGISDDEAKAEVQSTYDICLWVETSGNGTNTVFWGLSGNGDIVGKEDSGDTESSLRDIIELLNEGILRIEDFECDDSTDEHGNEVPAFIEE